MALMIFIKTTDLEGFGYRTRSVSVLSPQKMVFLLYLLFAQTENIVKSIRRQRELKKIEMKHKTF